MEFIGNLVEKVSEREGDGRNGHWKIASFLLETVEMYPKRMVVDVTDSEMVKRIEKFDELIGKNVKIAFDIDAREYNGRWFNSLRAFSIRENVSDSQGKHEPEPKQAEAEATASASAPIVEEQEVKDDLPF